MKESIKRYARNIASRISLLFILMDLHCKGVEGVNKAEAQKHLTIGNQLLHAGQLAEALTQFHTSIDNDPRNYQAYYMRATVYLAMGKARTALPDLDQVINLQPNFVKARLQRGNLYLKMGRFNDAQIDYEAVLSQEDNADAKSKVEVIRPLRRNINQASRMMQAKDYKQVVNLMKEVIEACPWNADFREMRAMAHEGLGDLRSAISDLKPTTTLRLDNTAGYLRISILYYNLGDVEQSLEEIRECLKLDPDHKECYAHYKNVKKLFKTVESGKTFMKESRWDDAVAKFNKALQQESRVFAFNVELKLKICECSVKKAEAVGAITSCKEVLKYEGKNIPALILLSEAYTLNSQYQEAVDTLLSVQDIDQNYPGLDEKIKQANKMLKQSQKRDYYKILGVSRNAKKKDIEKAYRKLAREWHPDNFKSEEEKKVAENKFIDLAAAKEVLTDPDKLRIYLAGYDPLDREDVEEWERGESPGEDINQIFKFFFHSDAVEKKKKPIDNFFKMFNRKSEEEEDDEDEEFLRESRRRKEEKMRSEERERMIREDERRRIEEELRKREEEELQRKMEEERIRKEDEHKRYQEEIKRKRELEEEKKRAIDMQRRQDERKRKYFEDQERRIQEEKAKLLHERKAHEERMRILQEQQRQYEYKREIYPGFSATGGNNGRKLTDVDATETIANQVNTRYEDNETLYGKSSKKKKGKKTTNGKKGKKGKKKKNRKNSQKADGKTARFTQGTGGKWYERRADGSWVPSLGPDATDTWKQSEREDLSSKESFDPSEGNTYVKTEDGSWYMRVDPPINGDAGNRRSDPTIRVVAGGVYKDNKGRIVDNDGNIYVTKSDSTLDIVGHVKDGSSQSRKKNDYAGRGPGVFGDPSKSYFRDKNGVPYYIDDTGNYVRVATPDQEKPLIEDPKKQFSSNDDPRSRARDRWGLNLFEKSSQKGGSNRHWMRAGDSRGENVERSGRPHRKNEDLRAEIMRQQQLIAQRLMDAQLSQSRDEYYGTREQKRRYTSLHEEL